MTPYNSPPSTPNPTRRVNKTPYNSPPSTPNRSRPVNMTPYGSPPSTPSSSQGLAMDWVFDHVLTHPTPYQITLPLRTIYALNCQPGTVKPTDFKKLLQEYLKNRPTQPSLPLSFLNSFIRRCFPPTLQTVDFDQALTALDYLRDLDIRRKQELERAARTRGNDWKIHQLHQQCARLDKLYAQALVGIRRWALIHELSSPRFSKTNCAALLNTLYPLEEESINPHLPSVVLAQQRRALWKYITDVQRHGVSVLNSIKDLNGGWEQVSATVFQYTGLAVEMIQMAEDMSRPSSYGSEVERQELGSRDEGKKTASTLERIVRGLQKLGQPKRHGQASGWEGTGKKAYVYDWMTSHEDVGRAY